MTDGCGRRGAGRSRRSVSRLPTASPVAAVPTLVLLRSSCNNNAADSMLT